MSEKILRLPEVKERTGLSRSSIYKLMSENLFPHSVKIALRAVGWYESHIDQFVESRKSGGQADGQ